MRTVDSYNTIINQHARELAAAYTLLQGYFRRAGARAPGGNFDRYSTMTYNNFSTLQAQYAFCQTAARIGKEALKARRGELGNLAATRMRELRGSLVPTPDRYAFDRQPIALSPIVVGPPQRPDCSQLRGRDRRDCERPAAKGPALEGRPSSPSNLCVWRLRLQRGSFITKSIDAASAASLSAQSIGWISRWRKSHTASASGSIPACGQTSFNSSPARWTTSVPALGLTQIQSRPAGRGQGAVGLDRDLEAARVERVDQGGVELQQGLAAGDDDQRTRPLVPQCGDLLGQRPGLVAAAIFAIHADEIGVAETA